MFSNIGGKIKVLAMILCWIGIGVSVLSGISILASESDDSIIGELMPDGAMAISGLLTMVIGSLTSWLSSFVLYGFGELIENVTSINYKLDLRSQSNQNPTTNTNVWKCTSCGQENSNNYGYCKHCGNPKA